MITWQSDAPPPAARRIGPAGWLRVAGRGVVIAVLLYGGLAVLFALRGGERLLCGQRRPLTPWMPRLVCRAVLAILGIRYRTRGAPMAQPGAVVANHSSWLDIFTLNACQGLFFVSKAEVARWPGIGFLARAAGTLFIQRDPKAAKAQQTAMEDRIRLGQRLLFFPEGTSSDGLRVLPFKSTLFQAFFAAGLRDLMWVQPVTVVYRAPLGEDPRFYGWWGSMEFGPHLLQLLAAPRGGAAEVIFHPSLRVADFASRKDLAAACEAAVRAGYAEAD
ncbi:1-acyl-sn-glycerol-3-phosphate acyltransferase [Sinirhodobacter populi]|uniref:1-acyl-sn-glycerol-3-phosphate acyltransferase n=1 Tax=Paenirhodobacter populi TaxID=2306993 RepID=A0A443KDL2_9RHOB|nr:lysophospholipid acyltransferase family protein [Sinirhodobacter populi]RWR30712.1 1-acyl-sn-glycerol-3-phosphate acyltransferase [Sinirhodobacter populi]